MEPIKVTHISRWGEADIMVDYLEGGGVKEEQYTDEESRSRRVDGA